MELSAVGKAGSPHSNILLQSQILHLMADPVWERGREREREREWEWERERGGREGGRGGDR